MLFGWIILDGIGKTLARTWFSIWLFIDSIVYGFVSTGYQVFLLLSKVSFYNTTDDKISQITSRIYVILGVAMLFVLAYNLILLIINPDNVSSKDSKSLKGFAKNFVISVVLLTLLPTIFSYMSKLQNDIMDSRVIEKIILGNDVTVESNKTHDLGKEIALMVFSSFYTPIDNEGNVVTYYQCKQDSSLSSSCSLYVKYYETAQKYGIASFIGAPELFEALFKSDGVFGLGAKVPTMQYLYFMSTIVGVVVALMFTSYAIDIAVRVAKLAFLQIIAPIPVILRITKPSGGIFSKWLDSLIKTYLTLFLRLITIYFSVELIAIFADNLNFGGIVDNSLNYPVMVYIYGRILIIVGILLFAKEAPKLLNNIAGNTLGEGGGFSLKAIKDKLSSAGAVAASIPIVGKGLKSTWGAVTGGLGAAASAVMNNMHGKSGVTMDTKAAMKQGAAQGFKNGGNQFGKQKAKTYADTYGFGKTQGILGGQSMKDKVDEKWGKTYSKNTKQYARDWNKEYVDKNVVPNLPKDKDGMKTRTSFFSKLNSDFAFSSSAYQKALDLVKAEEDTTRGGIEYPPEERKTKINEKLSQISATTTDAKEKRSIDSYLKREEISNNFNTSILTGNVDAINKVKTEADNLTKQAVQVEIQNKGGVDKVITDASLKAQLENKINASIQTKVDNSFTADDEQKIRDSFSSISLSPDQLEQAVQNKISEQKKSMFESMKNEKFGEMYQDEVENLLYGKMHDSIEKMAMENAMTAAMNDLTEQIKNYDIGKINGSFTDKLYGDLDDTFNQKYKNNEDFESQEIKTKTPQAETLEQLGKIIDYTKQNGGKLPNAGDDNGKK